MTPGRLVLPALRWQPETGFAHEEPAIAEALEFGAGGFILFGGLGGAGAPAEAVRSLTDRLRRDAGRPLLIASDLERGGGQQVRGLAELPPPAALAALDDDAVLRGAGVLTGAQALGVGINWVLAPVCDLDLEPRNPIVQTRAFSADPARVARAAASWIAGCEAAGALACAKHFPGHGRTTADSHDELPVVSADPALLIEADLVPFRAAVQAGVSSVMTAHVSYPGLDPSGAPATCSSPILDLLRTRLGFGGLIVSDALMMEGARAGRTPEAAALEALRAGVDLLLYPDQPTAVAAALVQAATTDAHLATRIEHSLGRYERALRQVDQPGPDLEPDPGSAEAIGDWVLSLPLFRGTLPVLTGPLTLRVFDDDVGQRWPPSSPPDEAERELTRLGVGIGSGGARVALVLSEPRASKGRAGLGAELRAGLAEFGPELVILFGHPRLAADLPTEPPVLIAWHRQRLMQRAAARWLRDRVA